ncbi:MAG: aquaporin [Alphaproteobacteria bacterium]
MKHYLAEFLGTLLLTLAVSFAMGATGFPVAAPVLAALAMGFGVYTLGSISGAHLNPAITLGMLVVKKIALKDAALYWAAQLIGAAAAMHIANFLIDMPDIAAADNTVVMISEMLGTFVFAFGVAAVASGRVSPGASGLAVGGSLLLGISMAAGSNGMLNPAVALGVGSFSLSYLIGPLVGAAIAMAVYKWLTE